LRSPGLVGYNSRSIMVVISNVALIFFIVWIIFVVWKSLVAGYKLGCNRWAVRRWIRRLKEGG
jgi:hypothetical protein